MTKIVQLKLSKIKYGGDSIGRDIRLEIADDNPKNPWKKGLYDIEIPDHPHEGGLNYPEAGRGTVWFRIGHSGERYLHPGIVSAGCISVTETKRWMEIYDTLIKARKGDFMSVGIFEVID